MSADNLKYTSFEEIRDIYARVNKTFKSGVTRPLSYRRRQLLQLARMMQDNITALEDALLADLGKQRQESITGEIGPIITGSIHAAESLEEWTKPEKPKVEAWRSSWDTTVYRVPKGAALLISPWNYPVVLAFLGLIGAIAAGCPTVLKPSEYSPATATLLADLIPKYLDPEAYIVVNGAVEEAQALLDLQWAHIFFTGSARIGRVIAAAAAKYTTPVSLELGGKSPVIISPDYDLELVARRILYGKSLNVGQLCVSPDYVLVPRSISKAFQEALKKTYASFFPIDPLHKDSNWGRIVNATHFKRITKLIEETHGEIFLGGKSDDNFRVALTIVTGVKLDDPLMEEEIFGPILPIVEVEDVHEAIQIVGDRPSPLVIYAFTNSNDVKNEIFEKTNSGTITLNDTQIQLAVYEMPFGGHGASGYGGYLGKSSYDQFTHLRSFINVPAEFEPYYALRYLPYTEESYKVMADTAHVQIPTE